MNLSDHVLGKFNITARLFKLITEMPQDQQFMLLKQLLGNKVSTQLFKLIVEMPEDRQLLLLEQMGEIPMMEMPVKTVSLEETETSMREHSRKPCLIKANYSVQGRDFKSYILDISIGGVFIETNEKVQIGQKIVLNFSLPSHAQPFSLTGIVAWSGPRGFGVRFDGMNPQQQDLLQNYVKRKD